MQSSQVFQHSVYWVGNSSNLQSNLTDYSIIQGHIWMERKMDIHEVDNKPTLVQNARDISFHSGNLIFQGRPP